MTQKKIATIFPDLHKISKKPLREKVIATWVESIKRGGWEVEELKDIPFTLLIEDAHIDLIQHTNNVTRTAIAIANELKAAYSDLKINMDILIAGALLHDVAKLMEYDRKGGKVVKSEIGKYLRHPIGGAALAAKHGLPDEIIHIIGSHSKEGDFARRTVEAIIVHHADFLNFEPFHQ
jgi:putative nucleotidyltransferase with HDIG domain